ncbi:hypothetical protein INS49_014271 [Diaporthe citri]|uniref:uncharacterized protein n=1 Tax=Diaporthe citri TaxID=83186 RepID=UPI001C7E349C|nr:uncharacterized protein INS49_014271 [Diaporthe citri]KAG6358387.1 hypothetical protein INS49_014271 [Diaporthe citri]
MEVSDTTKSIELKALEQAVCDDHLGRVGQAFSYIRDFKDSVPLFSLFEAFPYMEEPDDAKSQLPESLKTLYRDLDLDQKAAWKNVLSKLPARIGILSGGPGTGKTQLMMTISALVLAGHPPSRATGIRRGGPVLFVMEANRLVNDAATRIHQLCKQLGREDLVVVRGYNSNYENAYNILSAEDDDQSAGSAFEQWFPARRADHFPQIRAGVKGECPAFTVRDLIRQVFRSSADDFSDLAASVNDKWKDDRKRDINSVVRSQWQRLLQKALPRIDIMVTTVNGAAKIAPAGGHAFRPRLVIFDEAARARELSTLAAISNFPSTEAWLFTGTCELSRPYIGSHGNWKLWNPCKRQLRTPMMERAQHVVPDMQWLSQDPHFRSVDGKEAGSIAVVTPYRAQLINYKQEIQDFLKDLDEDHRFAETRGPSLHRDMRIEARSTDTVQSHSADLVILDLVHSKVTPHIDDPHRLAVSLTRARQAEVIVMHRHMVDSDGWAGSFVEGLYNHCNRQGQVVTVNMREQLQVERN